MQTQTSWEVDTGTSDSKRRILELAHEYVMPGRIEALQEMGVSLVIDRREGNYVWDHDGHQLIDLHLNGGTYSLGHRHPEILDTLRQAIETLDIGNHHFPSEPRAELGEMLAKHTPGDLHYSVFTSSGSEAIDVAVKSARYATGRRKIVGIEAGYHGRTGISGAIGDDSSARYFLSDQPADYLKVPFNDIDAMSAALSSGDVAAVVMETIPATSGFPLPDTGYLPAVKALCEKNGSLYVADEVQTGLGRTGCLWGVEHFGVDPDILVTGKGLSGGMYPIAATVLSRPVGTWLKENGWGHVSTFGGAEIACVVANKVLEITTRPEVLANVTDISRKLGEGFADIQTRETYLTEVRRCGVVMGLRFDHPDGAIHMMRALYEQGIWAIFAGFDSAVLQCKPSLIADDALCDDILTRFEAAIRNAKNVNATASARLIND